MEKLKIKLVEEQFSDKNDKFDQGDALALSGRIAGVCYDKEGYSHIKNEDYKKTERRIDMTLDSGHHSVYDHVNVRLEIQNIPKMLAMVINNEKQYATSEKSSRYTEINNKYNDSVSAKEEELYNKWKQIIAVKIKENYPDFSDIKVNKLAQENARYMVSVFVPTQMVYTTSLRQINTLAMMMDEYIENNNGHYFESKLSKAMNALILELEDNNLLVPGLLTNEKNRSLSLFADPSIEDEEIFSHIYSVNYDASFAQLAQAQRHRTLDYQMNRTEDKTYFIPPIIQDDPLLISEWVNDLESVAHLVPQAEMVRVTESGTYDNFILKAKERLCTYAQLEIAMQTKDTLQKYRDGLEAKKHYLADDIAKYDRGARCSFPDYKCTNDCGFAEGKKLIRKI